MAIKDKIKSIGKSKSPEKNSSNKLLDEVGAKLGINRSGRNYDKVKFELIRNRKNLKRLKIDEKVLKEFGLE